MIFFVQNQIARSQQDVDDCIAYQNALTTFTEWLKNGRERLAMCADSYGDKLTMTNRKEVVRVRSALNVCKQFSIISMNKQKAVCCIKSTNQQACLI